MRRTRSVEQQLGTAYGCYVWGLVVITPSQSVAKLGGGEDLWVTGLIAALSASAAALFISTPDFIVAVLLVSLVLTALLNFDLFVYSSIFLLPWYRNAYLVLPFVLFVGVCIRLRRKNASIREWLLGSKRKKGMAFFAGIAMASAFLSGSPADMSTYRSLALLASYLMIFFAIDGWLETNVQLVRLLKVLLISTIGVALFGFYQAINGGYTDLYFYLNPVQKGIIEPWSGRITSLLLQFNSLAGYLDLVIPVAIACGVLAKDRALRFLGISCACAAAVAVLLTQSRGGLMALAGALILAAWFLTPRRTARIKLLCGGVLACILLLPLLFSHFDRLQVNDDETWLSRVALWQAAGQMFLDHPVLGVGYGNYKSLYTAYIPSQENLDAHNLYLQFLAETGIIGFFSFAIVVGAFFFRSLRSMREQYALSRIIAFGVLGAITATSIHGTVDFLLNAGPQVGMLFWLLLGLGSRATDSDFLKRQIPVEDTPFV